MIAIIFDSNQVHKSNAFGQGLFSAVTSRPAGPSVQDIEWAAHALNENATDYFVAGDEPAPASGLPSDWLVVKEHAEIQAERRRLGIMTPAMAEWAAATSPVGHPA